MIFDGGFDGDFKYIRIHDFDYCEKNLFYVSNERRFFQDKYSHHQGQRNNWINLTEIDTYYPVLRREEEYIVTFGDNEADLSDYANMETIMDRDDIIRIYNWMIAETISVETHPEFFI